MMTTSKTTSRDRTMFALILVPILALVVLFATAGAKWRTKAAEIRPMLLESFPSEIIDAPSPMAANYDANTSTDQTQSVRELFVATSALNEKYEMMLDIVGDQEKWFEELDQQRPIDPYVREYLAEAQPLLRLLERLQPNLPSVWMPHEYDNPRNWSSVAESYDGLLRLLRTQYVAAVRAREPERAIRTLRISRRLGVHSHVDSQQILPAVAHSMAVAMWTESDLEQMDQLLTADADLSRKSQDSVRNSQLIQARWLLYDTLQHTYRRDTMEKTYAPSRRIDWLQRRQAYSSVGAIDSLRSLRMISEIDKESTRNERTELDVAIQFPSYGNYFGGGSMLSGFMADAKAANDRRFARSAGALAAFKMKFGSYPKSLDELRKVGLPGSETWDPLGRPFTFLRDDDGCQLVNASVWFSPSPRYPLRFSNDEEILATILGNYDVVEFDAPRPPSPSDDSPSDDVRGELGTTAREN